MTVSEIIEKARAMGFSGAELIDASDIVLSREFRDACEANRCGAYGKCYMCPPDVGEIDALMEKVRSYSCGILLQTVTVL